MNGLPSGYDRWRLASPPECECDGGEPVSREEREWNEADDRYHRSVDASLEREEEDEWDDGTAAR